MNDRYGGLSELLLSNHVFVLCGCVWLYDLWRKRSIRTCFCVRMRRIYGANRAIALFFMKYVYVIYFGTLSRRCFCFMRRRGMIQTMSGVYVSGWWR